MQPASETKQKQQLDQAVLSTLAFFAIYELPLSALRVHELLYDTHASLDEVVQTLEILAADNKIYKAGNFYSLKPWKADDYRSKQIEIGKKWKKIDRYFNWLAILPYVRLVSVINSLALGTADADSDIDFFVVTKNNKLYFVRSTIIVLFRILGVYKTRHKIKDKFCFGFFTTQDNLNLQELLIKPSDPYFTFWLANMRPVTDSKQYWEFMQANNWLLQHFPNFQPTQRLASAKKSNFFISVVKTLLEVILWLPATILEPLLRRIHINHTFKLAENHSTSSTTIAQPKMLKLHGYDVRAQVARAHADLLRGLQN